MYKLHEATEEELHIGATQRQSGGECGAICIGTGKLPPHCHVTSVARFVWFESNRSIEKSSEIKYLCALIFHSRGYATTTTPPRQRERRRVR